ncbi:hypothetical protein [Aliiroseovarius sp. 2305UL8-7]|uniref:hypothetical protein n=1 Tax=Aliiroseovarius conchicola TaxID=3121637 RepID=UPI003527AF78
MHGDDQSGLEDVLPDERILYDHRYELTDADVDFFREHPEELSVLDQRTTFRLGRLAILLVLAIALFAASKLIAVKLPDRLDALINSVFVDVLFEMGAALIGALATLLFLEIQDKRQLRDNLRLRGEIRRRIKARDTTQRDT